MKSVLLVLAFASPCLAASSSSACYGKFLNNLDDQINHDSATSAALETEFRDDYKTLCHKCYSPTSDGDKCYLPDEDLNGDVYGDNGPLKGCVRCQQMCRSLRDKYMNSSEATRTCFRKHLADGIKDELQPCIQNKLQDPSFECPDIPDFDRNTFHNIKIAEAGINYRIMANSRMDVCSTANPAKYAVTGPCMQNEYPGIYGKHCLCAKNAKHNVVSSSCASTFANVKSATCQCMEEKRVEWHTKFDKIKKIVNDAANGATSAKDCGDDISNVLGTWLSKIQTALTECMPASSSDKNRDLHTLIKLGCGQVVNGGVQKNELTVGFRFVRLFLDALNDRLTVFCDKNCNF